MNVKQELSEALKGNAKIKCALIYYDNKATQKILKINHSVDEFNDFLDSLDFTYDDGYGGQELFGTVWLEDNTWLSRGEYDGSEWWEHNVLPNIPKECK